VSDLTRSAGLGLAPKIASKEVSPVELMTAVLARRRGRCSPVLNCFITLIPEQAMAGAKQAEDDVMQGQAARAAARHPLRGPRTWSTPPACAPPSARCCTRTTCRKDDAVATARMKQAGAILFGKTTTPEFGHKALTDAPLFGRTRNAWSAERTSAARAAARRSPSPPASGRSAWRPTAAARRASRRRPTAWSG
jgi:aspartyl-tRNA(Asn)/glutamyl-tRNA(Gln) amidotransferase subunit A